MATDQSFSNFITALGKYHTAVDAGKFPAYASIVTPTIDDPSAIVALGAKDTSKTNRAVRQQAADMMAASRRARALRSMTLLDIQNNRKQGLPFQQQYEQSRLTRYQAGQF